jgi:NADH-quinone oxidoreductase subunit L
MYQLLWLIPALPFAGFLILALFGRRAPSGLVAAVAVASVGLSTALTAWIALDFLLSPPAAHAYTQTLWTWMQVAGFAPGVAFYLDAASLLMMLVVTFVGLLIHIYSTAFMSGDEGYSRFFAYMNLFVASMLVLVMADNLFLLYLGWEGVGLCSYLLIGFWYDDPDNGRAARKAFLVTRVGDAAMAVGLFLLFDRLGTLNIQELMQRATEQWPAGSALPVAAALLLLGGAVGKSAQLPLQIWLPDAMAGPTPVSALIHAATMVTAGVYLIARMHALYTLAPAVQTVVAIVGAATLLLAGFSALVQRDIKRVLAYSTISQIGYMFLALGVGAWAAALFHLMVHAFFKALLFLGAGAIILALEHEHDMFKMGGLRRQLPLTFWTFLIGAGSLSAVPLVTAGFYSKDTILFEAWSSPSGSVWLWLAGLLGALLTSMYTFRMVFITFFGEAGQKVSRRPGPAMQVPLLILAALSVVGGLVNLPRTLGNVPLLFGFLHTALPASEAGTGVAVEAVLQAGAAVVSLVGIYVAYLAFYRYPALLRNLAATPMGGGLHRFWFTDWGLDWLYAAVLVRPYAWLARVDRRDVIDLPFLAVAWLSRGVGYLLGQTQTGYLRWYAAAVALGALVAIGIVAIL